MNPCSKKVKEMFQSFFFSSSSHPLKTEAGGREMREEGRHMALYL